jgi:succinate-acetate transporter protein
MTPRPENEGDAMSQAPETHSPAPVPAIADPTPIGLICLAIGCAALTPIAFGASLTPAGLRTAAIFCLLFGAGGQLVAGLGNLFNKNLYGATLFTSFAFNWIVNWWALDGLSRGQMADPTIVFAVDVCFLVVFLVFTYGFGFFSSLLMAFLIDIDLLYIARIAFHLSGGAWLGPVIGVCTVALGLISLWMAFAVLINPVAGRAIFAFPGPAFRPKARP